MERGSVIDAQVTLLEEVEKEIERCKDPIYWYNTYWIVNGQFMKFIPKLAIKDLGWTNRLRK